MRRVLVGTLLLALTAACSSDLPVDDNAVIVGRLVSGPTCPVETNPPDPECAPQAVPGAEIVATLPDGTEIRVRSAQDGTFRLVLPPGSVVLSFDAVEGLMTVPAAITAIVRAGQTVDLSDLTFDTGIR